jgi:nucleoside-diphosphate-sugar epimerase
MNAGARTVKQRVLVFGADNFIGKRVAQALAQSDWAEPVAARSDAALVDGPTVQDGVALPAGTAALDDVAAVVNCAGGSPQDLVRRADALFAAAARAHHPPRIVHLSSQTVYGAREGDVDESTALSAELGAYAAAKVHAERLAAAYPAAVVLRPGVEYGPDCWQWSGRVARWLQARRLGDLGVAGDGCCNLVYIDDAVAAVLGCLRAANVEGRIFNLSLPQPPTWNDYFMRYAKALGAVPVARITKRQLAREAKLWAPPLKLLEIIVGKAAPGIARALPIAIPPSAIRLFGQEIRLTVGATERALDLRWTPVEEGLTRAAAHYRVTR